MRAESDMAGRKAVMEQRFRYFPSIPLPQPLPPAPLAIADMANLFGVTHRTLHFYEERKLIHADRAGAMRVYDLFEVRVMALINLCRETGMPVAQIQELLAEIGESGSQREADSILRAALLARKRELLSNESLIRRQMQQVNQLLADGLPGDQDDGQDHPAPFLNDFEFECLALMSEGYTPIRIGNVTGRSVDEILSTEVAIIRKFGSSNRFQAVAKAVLLGIIAG